MAQSGHWKKGDNLRSACDVRKGRYVEDEAAYDFMVQYDNLDLKVSGLSPHFRYAVQHDIWQN